MNELDILAQIGDLKEIDYRNTLAIASLIEVLVEKGLITRHDIARKSKELDSMSLEELKVMRLRNF
ncbi:MAG: hypothetical protein FH751_07675 [Firmicutes bacterium]|nr:hypothetical protein [Bacillota bacterium]